MLQLSIVIIFRIDMNYRWVSVWAKRFERLAHTQDFSLLKFATGLEWIQELPIQFDKNQDYEPVEVLVIGVNPGNPGRYSFFDNKLNNITTHELPDYETGEGTRVRTLFGKTQSQVDWSSSHQYRYGSVRSDGIDAFKSNKYISKIRELRQCFADQSINIGIIELIPFGSKNFGEFIEVLHMQAEVNLGGNASIAQIKEELKRLLTYIVDMSAKANFHLIQRLRPKVLLVVGSSWMGDIKSINSCDTSFSGRLRSLVIEMNRNCIEMPLTRITEAGNTQKSKIKVMPLPKEILPKCEIIQIPHLSGSQSWSWGKGDIRRVSDIIAERVQFARASD